MNLIVLLAACLLLLSSVNAQTNITSCASLQAITLNNAAVTYNLLNDIDCSSYNPFPPLGTSNSLPFKGILDGKGFKIKNLKLNDTNRYVGIFRAVNGGIIRNLTLQDISVTGSNQNVGSLFGVADNITVEDVHMVTSLLSQNLIQVTGTFISNIGGVGGQAKSGTFNRVSVTNTSISASTAFYVGGVTNLGIPNLGSFVNPNISASYVFNYGFPANPSQIIINATSGLGGVFGSIAGGNISNSGTMRGTIFGATFVGGFAGSIAQCDIDSVFVKSDVKLTGSDEEIGGLFGGINSENSTTAPSFTISNVYSRVAKINGNLNLGGLVGQLLQFDYNVGLTFSNAYVATNVSGPSNASALFGTVTWNSLTINKVYFDNTLATDTRGTGLSCSQLFANVQNNFPSNKWGNDRLKIEPDYSLGVCNCTSGCTTSSPTTSSPTTSSPTTASPTTSSPTTSSPTTSAPTTTAPTTSPTTSVSPTTAPTTSPIDFSGVYNVDASCQNSQTCCCPSGKVSVIQQNNLVTVSISQVTGNCTKTGAQAVVFTMTSSTSGTGVFNGVSYTASYSNQKISFSATNGCSTTAGCESGNCRSLPSSASIISVSSSLFLMVSLLISFLFYF